MGGLNLVKLVLHFLQREGFVHVRCARREGNLERVAKG